MKLRRFLYGTAIAPNWSGRWLSYDCRWMFSRDEGQPWFISSIADEGDYEDAETREAWLGSVGLYKTPFKTRREAIAALELALAGEHL